MAGRPESNHERASFRDNRLRMLCCVVALALTFALGGCEGGDMSRLLGDPTSADALAKGRDADSAGQGAIIYEASDASMLDEPGGVSDAKAFFSYADSGSGSHIVQGLHNVPGAYQSTARNMSNGNTRGINHYNAAASVRKSAARPAATTPGSEFNPNRLDVTVFSADWCGACKRARQYLDSEGVDYDLRDIDDDPDAREQVRLVLGKVRIPLIDINGSYVTGYDKKMIKKLITGG